MLRWLLLGLEGLGLSSSDRGNMPNQIPFVWSICGLLLLCLGFFPAGCIDSGLSCKVGEQRACICPSSGKEGTQSCNGDQTGYGLCRCETTQPPPLRREEAVPTEPTKEAPQVLDGSEPSVRTEPPIPGREPVVGVEPGAPTEPPVPDLSFQEPPSDRGGPDTLVPEPQIPEPPPGGPLLQGVVRDAKGNPVANATMLFNSRKITTDSQGRYQIYLQKGDDYRVRVSAERKNNKDVWKWEVELEEELTINGDQTKDYKLPPTSMVTGIVTGGNQPLAGIPVTFVCSRCRNEVLINEGSTVTDSMGMYRFETFQTELDITASPPANVDFGHRSDNETIRRDTTVNFSLEARFAVTGVITEDGVPVAGAQVRVVDDRVTTDAKGAYVAKVKSGDRGRVTVAYTKRWNNNKSFLDVGYTHTTSFSTTQRTTLNIDVGKWIQASGKVSADQLLVADARVAYNCRNCGAYTISGQVYTDTKGTYKLSTVPGSHSFSVSPSASFAQNYGTLTQTNTLKNGDVVDFSLPKKFSVTGKVRTAAGAAVSGVRVSLGPGSGVTDATGSFSFATNAGSYVPSLNYSKRWNTLNTYDLTFAGNGGKAVSITKATSINFTFPQLYKVTGSVTKASKAVYRAYVYFRCTTCPSPVTSSRLRVYTDTAGKFSADIVGATYNVTSYTSPTQSKSITINKATALAPFAH